METIPQELQEVEFIRVVTHESFVFSWSMATRRDQVCTIPYIL